MSTPTPTSFATTLPVGYSLSADDKKSSPTYLCIKRGIYYFRYALPPEYRQRLGRREVRISLRTSYLRVARFRSRMLFAEVEKAFLEGIMLEYKEIRRRMNVLLQRLLEQDHSDLSDRKNIVIGAVDIPLHELYASYAEIGMHWNNSSVAREKMAADVLTTLLLDGVFLPEEIKGLSREQYLEIVKAVTEMNITHNRLLAARLQGDFLQEEQIVSADFGLLPREAQALPLEATVSTRTACGANDERRSPRSMLYSDAVERYISQKLSDGEWREHSVVDHRGRLSEFLTIVGDKPIGDITREDMRHFREVVRKLPPNRTRVEEFKGKSIDELLALDVKKTLSVTTVNILVEAVGSMLGWYVREGLLESNPATHLQIKDQRQAVELRDAFSSEELTKIFAHPKFSQKKFKSLSYYWIPMIALYTGMRLEEIAQLHCADLYESATRGIWVIDINDSGLDEQGRPKLLKNKNARRIVPVHPTLVKFGLLDYHAEIIKIKHIRLFPELKKSDGAVKFGKQPGKQFKSVVDATIGSSSRKTFHSLRHTFSDFYKQRGLQNDYFRQVFGHALPALAAHQYGAKFPPELLYEEVIVKLDYGVNI